ncbi:hypothetical protein KEM56_000740 [Ascosphaera pollenicola]|nr:hypothetical protein KEM56_000740 [Ascosphaera pollenicola]
MSENPPHLRQENSTSSDTPPSEPRAWSDPPTVMPESSTPSISKLLHDYIDANGLLTDKEFLDIILCSEHDVAEFVQHAKCAEQQPRTVSSNVALDKAIGDPKEPQHQHVHNVDEAHEQANRLPRAS